MCKNNFLNETAASDKVNSDKQEVIPPTNAQSADSRMHGAISKDPNPTSVDKSSLKKIASVIDPQMFNGVRAPETAGGA